MQGEFARAIQRIQAFQYHEKMMETVRSLNLDGPQEQIRQVLRATAGTTEALRQSFETLGVHNFLADIKRQREIFETRFTIPDNLRTLLENNERALEPFQHSLHTMQHPWLDTTNQIASIRAFAQLQDLTSSVAARLEPFSIDLTEKLRNSLGDWTAPFEFPEHLLDPVVRVQLYDEHGFDSALTEFPRAAFVEALSTTGIAPVPPTEGDETEPDDEQRAQKAYSIITRLERSLRAFIVSKLKAAEGINWYKRRIPPALRSDWEIKKERAIKVGESPNTPLIDYADFSHYVVSTQRTPWLQPMREYREMPPMKGGQSWHRARGAVAESTDRV